MIPSLSLPSFYVHDQSHIVRKEDLSLSLGTPVGISLYESTCMQQDIRDIHIRYSIFDYYACLTYTFFLPYAYLLSVYIYPLTLIPILICLTESLRARLVPGYLS